MALFSYKITHDSGFAPNPFGGYLTLATCKPGIRRTKSIGDWIAGFTSATLCRDPVGEEHLVYLMKVAEKRTIAEYFDDDRFRSKIPNVDADTEVCRIGDNIYRPLRSDARDACDFEQLTNPNHWDGKISCSTGMHKKRDTSGQFVLIARKFVYFGRHALYIPPEIRPVIPYGVSNYGNETLDMNRCRKFIDYVFDQANGRSIIASPHDWPNEDDSWKHIE